MEHYCDIIMSLTLNPMPLNMTSILWTLYAILVFCTNSSIISTLYNLASGRSVLWFSLFEDIPPEFSSIIIPTLFQSTTIVGMIIEVKMEFQIIYITRLNGVLAFNKILSYFMQYNGSIEYTTLDHNILSQSNTSICSFPLIFNVGLLSLYSNQWIIWTISW